MTPDRKKFFSLIEETNIQLVLCNGCMLHSFPVHQGNKNRHHKSDASGEVFLEEDPLGHVSAGLRFTGAFQVGQHGS